MTARPSEYPRWAYTTSDVLATNTTDPGSSQRDTGYTPSQLSSSSFSNRISAFAGLWIQFLDGGGRGATISPAGLTAHQDDWAPTGIATAGHVRVTITTAARNITGISAGQTDGRRITLSALDGNVFTLKHEDA